MRSFLLLFTLSILSVACSSDKAEVVDLYDIDKGEEIVVLPSAELKIPKNLEIWKNENFEKNEKHLETVFFAVRRHKPNAF